MASMDSLPCFFCGKGKLNCLFFFIPLLLVGCVSTGENPSDPRHEMVTPSLRETLGSVLSFSPSSVGEQTVEVRATGATRSEARDEAVRTALQATVSQLVIADRLVSDSELINNDIYATQNGFVTGFSVLEESRNELGEYDIHARVTVSDETIVNYVALQDGGKTSFDGASLFAEVRRGEGQRQVISNMFERFARGYPFDVVSLSMTGIQPVEGHSDRVVASLITESDDDYFIAMQQFLERVARGSYRTSYRFRRGFHYPRMNNTWSAPSTYATTKVCMIPRPWVREIRFLGHVTSGVNQQGEVNGRCYILPAGDHSSFFWNWSGLHASALSGIGSGGAISFLVAFLDDQGRSVVRPHAEGRIAGCLLVGGGGNYPNTGIHMKQNESWSPTMGLAFRASRQNEHNGRFGAQPSTMVFSDVESAFNVVFSTASVDFERAESFRGRPVFTFRDRNGGYRVMSDLAGPPADPNKLCSELIGERRL